MIIESKENKYFKSKNTIRYNGELIDLTSPMVMGILNITPDSFYDGGRYDTIEKAILHTLEMLDEGASIIDIGACSTRPGAAEISADEELKRLLPVMIEIRKSFPNVILSVDTFRSVVAEKVVNEVGDCIINDISGGTLDNHMFETVARLKVPYVLMNIQGTPQTMQTLVQYDDVVSEVLHFMEKRLARLHLLGVNDVIIDPGFGFAKTMEQNYTLLNRLEYFNLLNVPILAGMSRKSMLTKLLGIDGNEALNATTAANMLALMGGASILRVHDVKEARQTIEIYNKYFEA